MNEPLQTFTRGSLAQVAGVNLETIRFYETKGLLPFPERNASGYRQYDASDAQRLRFIKRAQDLGFTLREIKELLSLRALPKGSNQAVKQLAEEKIEAIAAKIRDLKQMKQALIKISAECDGHGTTSECPILQAMEGAKGCCAGKGGSK